MAIGNVPVYPNPYQNNLIVKSPSGETIMMQRPSPSPISTLSSIPPNGDLLQKRNTSSWKKAIGIGVGIATGLVLIKALIGVAVFKWLGGNFKDIKGAFKEFKQDFHNKDKADPRASFQEITKKAREAFGQMDRLNDAKLNRFQA